jgi:hypothetical protein
MGETRGLPTALPTRAGSVGGAGCCQEGESMIVRCIRLSLKRAQNSRLHLPCKLRAARPHFFFFLPSAFAPVSVYVVPEIDTGFPFSSTSIQSSLRSQSSNTVPSCTHIPTQRSGSNQIPRSGFCGLPLPYAAFYVQDACTKRQ